MSRNGCREYANFGNILDIVRMPVHQVPLHGMIVKPIQDYVKISYLINSDIRRNVVQMLKT